MDSQILHIPQWFGGGLGNEFFPFAKANLAAQAVGGRVYFPLQLDFVRKHPYFAQLWVRSLVHRCRPGGKIFYYRPEEYLLDAQNSGTFDYRENVKRLVARLPEGRKRIVHGGMAGGFAGILAGRPFIRDYLSSKVSDAAFSYAQMLAIRDPRRITIGVHIRRGDFRMPQGIASKTGSERSGGKTASAPSSFSFGTIFKKFAAYNKYDLAVGGIQGKGSNCETKWNQRIPIEWFTRIMGTLAESFQDQVEFLLVTDGLPSEEKGALITASQNAPLHWGTKQSPQKDLLLLASCDALICSTSSFSMWGAFLSEAPAIFYRDHLSDAHTDAPYFWNKPTNLSPAECDTRPWCAIGLADEPLPNSFRKALSHKLGQKRAWLRSPVMGGAFSS